MVNEQRTVFVTGGTGYIGTEVVRALARERPDLHLVAIARSESSARRLRELGADPVLGDLTKPGKWQESLRSSNYVIHAAQPPVDFSKRLSRAHGERYQAQRGAMVEQLIAALDPRPSVRVIHCAGNSYYGRTDSTPRDETMTPDPIGFGAYIRDSIERFEAAAERGLDVVTVFPAAVYGDGAWLKEFVLKPLGQGKRLAKIGGGGALISPMYVKDVARAMVHMLDVQADELDQIGRRVFLVDGHPVTYEELHEEAARLLDAKLRYFNVPGFMFRLMAGPIVHSYMTSHTVYSNTRLRALGFEPRYPTIREGLRDLLHVQPL